MEANQRLPAMLLGMSTPPGVSVRRHSVSVWLPTLSRMTS